MGTYVPGSVWYYAPNKIAPIVFIVFFFISGAVHLWQMARYKAWRINTLLPWAAVLMMAGFITRELGAYHVDNLTFAIASIVLFLSGPPVYALINYLILSRVLYYMPYLSPMHPGRVVTTFVGIDGIIEILIAQGGWRASNSTLSPHERLIGVNLVKSALLMQVVMFISFGYLTVIFERRATKAGVLPPKIRVLIHVLYVSSAIVTIRCIYRIVEFFQGYSKPPFNSEPYFWVFEASIMLINSVMLNIWNPGARLPKSNTIFLAKDGVTEMHGPGWADDRPWPVTIFDPFDVWGLFTGRDKEKFWDLDQEQLTRLVEERKANKRPWHALIVDPFHLWGPKGYIGKHLVKSKPAETSTTQDDYETKGAQQISNAV